MSKRCDLCSKKKQIGRQSRHKKGVAGKQWAKRAQKTVRVFKPNLQWVTIEGVRMRLCTKCLKMIKNKKQQAKEIQTPDSPVETASK